MGKHINPRGDAREARGNSFRQYCKLLGAPGLIHNSTVNPWDALGAPMAFPWSHDADSRDSNTSLLGRLTAPRGFTVLAHGNHVRLSQVYS